MMGCWMAAELVGFRNGGFVTSTTWIRSLGQLLLGLVVVLVLSEAAMAATAEPDIELVGGVLGLALAWRVGPEGAGVLRLITAGFGVLMVASGLMFLWAS
jgi:hypothetical protein